MSRRHAVLTACLLVMAASLPAGAPLARDGRPDVKVDVTAMKEIVQRDVSGKESVRLAQPDPASPGDTLVYRISYTNQGTAEARNAQVIDPIPAGTLLVPGSWDSQGADFSVSIDGAKTFEAFPARRPITLADGSTVMKAVELSAYTHVRWTSQEPLAPGAKRSAAFKVTVR